MLVIFSYWDVDSCSYHQRAWVAQLAVVLLELVDRYVVLGSDVSQVVALTDYVYLAFGYLPGGTAVPTWNFKLHAQLQFAGTFDIVGTL